MKVKVPDVDPPAGLCWKQRLASPHSMERCDRRANHGGPCLPGLVAENERLRALLKDSTLFLRTAEGALEIHQGTPWMDGLQQLITLNEAALDAKGTTR
jgi:hypothetical protein